MKHWLGLAVCSVVVVFGCSTKTQNFNMCSDVEMDCDGTCVSVANDPRNCGGCGIQCKSGQACVTGLCGCAQGMMVCGTACTDIKTDTKNCGACGTACKAGETCTNGACKGTCANTMTDPANCGTCGHACGAMEICANGMCMGCNGDGGTLTVCKGDGGASCVDTQTDKSNCGMCGNACTGMDACVGGQCKPPCTPSWLASNQSWTQNNLTYASEILNNTYNPTNLLDNNLTTRWVTSSTTNQWVIFNFGAPATLSGIQIVNQANYTPNAGGKDTIVQTGPGLNGPWTNVTMFTVANQQSSFQMFNFNKATSQYWRVFVQNNWGYQSYIQFMEVGFYGCL